MAKERRVNEFVVEGARLLFRNFQGRKTEFNDEGNRNFCLMLSREDGERLKEEGWNVKFKEPRNEDEQGLVYLPVKVKYGKIPPIAMLITSRGKTRLSEETIGQLDYARIKNVDLIVRPYEYPATALRDAGIAAYLKSIYVTIQEDALEEKYGSLPDADISVNDSEDLPFDE